MGDPEAIELPIFELGLAIVPGERGPLHIFERRYRLMIAHCLERGAPFGIVLRDGGGARSIGCGATVTEVVERYEDGRLDIVVTGSDRFRVLDRPVGAREERADAAADAFAIAVQVELAPAEKQTLLEADGERERLIAVERSLQQLLAGLARSRELGERA